MFSNSTHSAAFEAFMGSLAERVELASYQGYKGELKVGDHGTESYATSLPVCDTLWLGPCMAA
jgi:hypothetical protein